MPKTIVQKIVFKNTTPKTLYDMYMNAAKHSKSTGAVAKITNKEGAKFSAYEGYCFGKNLQLIKDKMIVQSWRAADWDPEDVDSTFIILLEQKGKDVVLHAVHANIPDKQAKSLDKGWHQFYWEPWKAFLAGKPVPKSAAM